MKTKQHSPFIVRNMIIPTFLVALALWAITPDALAGQDFDIAFSAEQSLFQGGPSAGFDYADSFGSGNVGIDYRAVANSGTVDASVNGTLETGYPTTVPLNTPATVSLQFVATPNGGHISSTLGANVNVGAYFDFNINYFFSSYHVNKRMDLLNEGFFVNPNRSFTPESYMKFIERDEDNALGVGPGIDLPLGLGSLSAKVNVDVVQSISFTPSTISGTLVYSNQATGETGELPFNNLMGAGQIVNLTTQSLGAGIWSFRIVDISLHNSFNNNIDLLLRPTIGYIIDDWTPVEQSIDVLNETFALNFNKVQITDAFTVEVQAPVEFTDLAYSGDGCSICFTAMPDECYTLMVSSNLVDWIDLTDCQTGLDGCFQFTDETAVNCPTRFYRLRSQ